MRFIIAMLGAIMLSSGMLIGQTDSTFIAPSNVPVPDEAPNMIPPYGWPSTQPAEGAIGINREGKVHYHRNGQWIPLKEDKTLKDGSLVNQQGQVIRKDGTSTSMKTGDWIDAQGKWYPYEEPKLPPVAPKK